MYGLEVNSKTNETISNVNLSSLASVFHPNSIPTILPTHFLPALSQRFDSIIHEILEYQHNYGIAESVLFEAKQK